MNCRALDVEDAKKSDHVASANSHHGLDPLFLNIAQVSVLSAFEKAPTSSPLLDRGTTTSLFDSGYGSRLARSEGSLVEPRLKRKRCLSKTGRIHAAAVRKTGARFICRERKVRVSNKPSDGT